MYLNAKSHLMNNDNKPTALANPQRTPPFAIDVDLPTSSDTLGGRFHATLTTGPLSYKLGFDTYRLQQNATQTVSDRDTGQIHHNMHPVWPEAEIVNVGGYAQVVYDLARSTIGGTVRIDREQARVGGVTQFFAENAVPAYGLHEVHGHFHLQAPAHGGHQMGGHGMLGHGTGRHSAGPAMLVSADHFGQNNVNVSAAANASLRITDSWLVNLGAGRAVRNPSVRERYADRFPAVKFQTAAEFVGNPLLVPEKSLEVNAGTMLRVAQATFEADVFWRSINDYITVAFDPNLTRRLPLSPARVFRYVQADSARFAGLDLRAESAAGPWLSLRGGWSFVRAEDLLFDEPLFGVPPFEQQYAIEIHNPSRTWWAELQVTNTAEQNRVATARLELPTGGWTTIDLAAGGELVDGVTLRAGVRNLTDEFYFNHMNSLDPFSGQRIAAIGRIRENGADTIDAEGHVVTPGFVDGHTHMDAQVFWDPIGSCSCYHGVTSVVMGNCGFTLAPCREEEADLVFRNLERAEDIARESMIEGIRWRWETYPEYLDVLDALPKGINYAGYIGHSALRTYVMGERAFTEPAGEDDLARMAAIVTEAVRAGAMGFTTSRSPNHQTAGHKPVASRAASWDEVRAIVGAMGETGAGMFEIAGERTGPEPDRIRDYHERLKALSVETGVPVTGGMFASRHAPELWRQYFDLLDETAEAGGRMFAQVHSRSLNVLYTFESYTPFDGWDVWRDVRALPLDEQRVKLADATLLAKRVDIASRPS